MNAWRTLGSPPNDATAYWASMPLASICLTNFFIPSETAAVYWHMLGEVSMRKRISAVAFSSGPQTRVDEDAMVDRARTSTMVVLNISIISFSDYFLKIVF